MEPLELLRSPLLSAVRGVVHGFSTRRGGVSRGVHESLNLSARAGDAREHVEENRGRLLAALVRPDAVLVTVRQVHGDTAVEVTRQASRVIEADALWTRDPGAAVAVLVADCVPILIAASDGRAVAAVHAGWRGTRARIAARAVESLAAAGFAPGGLVAALGPAIGPCCFAIGEEVESELRAAYPDAGEAIRRTPEGRIVADLWALNRAALLAAGVPGTGVDVFARCTSCMPEDFYSHRRDQGSTGRQAGVIALAPR